MKTQTHFETLIPPSLLEQVEALAAAEHRPAGDMLREAIEGFLRERRALPASEVAGQQSARTAQAAAARILERRKRHLLPDGVTIRDLMTYGRA